MSNIIDDIAQTNLQLYLQIKESNLPDSLVRQIQQDYHLAVKLFGDIIRSTGKPFLCHAVGTASMAMINGATATQIRAALLHAAYSHGKFPRGKTGATANNRDWLRSFTDNEVESLVYEYRNFPFNQQSVDRFVSDERQPSPLERSLLLIRISNEVDDSAHYGALLGNKRRYKNDEWLNAVIALCDKLKLPHAKSALVQACRDLTDADWLEKETSFDRRVHQPNILKMIRSKLPGRKK